ncbi:MAG: cation transporter [Deltaproteobacteria bacterium]|nr:cation transporter [Deltaproteobacteria bacterium]
MKEGSRRAIIAAFLANLGIAAAKFVGFAFTGAASMLAEAVHSLADTGNQGLLFLGGARARKSADEEHPFGHGHERYFWGFVVAMVLFTMGALFAIYEGIEKLRTPHALESPGWAVGILTVAIVLEGLSFRTAIKEARALRGGESWWQFIRHTKTPELPVVLLEDTGALIGLVLALAGIGLALLTGNPRFDAMGSIAIGCLLGTIAAVLAVEMRSLLIGESAGPRDVAAVRAAITGAPRVRRIIHLRTLHLGPEELLVAVKVEFDPTLTIAELGHAIDAVEARIRASVPIAKLIYLEPDVFRPPAG